MKKIHVYRTDGELCNFGLFITAATLDNRVMGGWKRGNRTIVQVNAGLQGVITPVTGEDAEFILDHAGQLEPERIRQLKKNRPRDLIYTGELVCGLPEDDYSSMMTQMKCGLYFNPVKLDYSACMTVDEYKHFLKDTAKKEKWM